jgi:4a-hydroxytetrahydrobiopterin dehydratase
MAEILDNQMVETWAQSRQGWCLSDNKAGRPAIEKTYCFADYNAAIGFIMRVALVAERCNHHPDIYNHYKRVTVIWSSHAAGGVTNLDIDLADQTDRLALGPSDG